MRLIGLKPPLDVLLDDRIVQVSKIIREAVTAEMMELKLPHKTLRLAVDLRTDYPPTLRYPTYPPLLDFMRVVDPPANVRDRGARDWSDFAYRMHYIARLFRSFQEDGELLQPPFADARPA